MSQRDLSPEEAAKLPRVLYSPAEISAMIGIEYRRVMAAIHDGDIPSEKFGRIYRVPAWWVEQHRTGVVEAATPVGRAS